MFFVKKVINTADREITRIASVLKRPGAFFKSWGNAVTKAAKASARAKGGKSFWRGVADKTRLAKSDDTGAIVECDHPAGAFKETGGVIRPRYKKALTIPISDEARGKTFDDFVDGGRELFTINSKKTDTIGITGYVDDNDNFHALFALRTKVTQKPDPWFPSDETIGKLGLKEADLWLDRQLRSNA